MKLLRRIALVVLIVFLVVGVGLYLASRYYLSSSNVTGQVSKRLQAMLGAPVQVGSADVGLTGASSLHGLRIFEPGDQTEKTPIVTVDSATADASALDLAEGKSPNEVTLTGASIALHFGADGQLLTRMPRPKTGGGPMPHVRIDNGKLTLNQDGRAPMVIQGVKMDLASDGGDLKATGAVADPFWGDWSLDGSFKDESGAVDLTLAAKDVLVDAARLKGLAFVPPDVWREVLVTGKTSCTFNLGLQLADNPAIHYRVACAPTDAKVHVESIKLDATGASGNVVVDDNLVQLRGVHGRFSGGEIATDGDLDFRKPEWSLLFSTISVDKVVLHDLPAEWRKALLPEAIRKLGLEGQLTGQATNIRVAPVDGQVKVTGDGQGQVDQVVLDGQPQSPIKLKLGSKNGQFGSVSRNLTPGMPGLVLAALVAVPPAAPPAAPPPPALPDLKPADLAGWVPNALVWATGRGVNGLNKGITFLGGLIKPAPAGAEPAPEYLDIDLALEDVDLGQLLQRLQFKLPFPVEGKLSFKVHASIPINTPRDMKNYRLTGTANLPRVNVAGVEMADVSTRLTLDNGLLELQELKGRAILPAGGAGTFAGTARMRIAPLGDLSADLNVDRFPLAAVLNLLPGAGGKADGSLTGHVTARTPAQTLTDLTTWHAMGTLSSDRIAAYGLTLTAVSADLSVDAGTAKASAVKATLEKAALTGSAELALASPGNYSGTLTLSGADLKAVQGLNPDFRPPFPVEGAADVMADLKGTLRPLTVAASGSAKASDLTLDRFKVDSLSFKWDLDGDRLKLTDAKASLYQGDVTGSVTLPVRAAAAGAVDLRLDGVDVQALAKSLPAVPVQVTGKASGTVAATLPPAGPDGERAATAKIDLTAKKLSVQNIPADNLHADVDYKTGAATYHLEGESLGGRFKLDGKYPSREGNAPAPGPAAPAKEPPAAESSGRFQFNDIRLSRLGEALGLGTGLGQLGGRADIDLPFRAVADGATSSGTGRLTVRDLRLGDTSLTDRLTADLILRDQTVQVRNLSASVNEGDFRGTVVYNYANPDRSYFNLRLGQVDSAALLAGYPDLAAQVQGPIDLHLRGNLGREWRGSGEAALTRGRVYGVEVEEWRLPFTFTFHPRHGNGQLTFTDSNVQLQRGRIEVRADLHWSYESAPRLQGDARFYNADLRSLLGPNGQLSSYAVGRVTGHVDFSSDALRTADDLEATVAAALSQSQALQIPVLSALVPFIAPGRSATTFDSGELRGRLSRGIFRIQKLNLSSRVTGLNVVGTITTTGRLDLEATAGTGRLGVNPNFLQALGVTIPAVGPIPVGVLLEISAYLSNRVIHLRVTGTTRNPQVRTEPIRLLAEEAVRFFVLQSGVPVP